MAGRSGSPSSASSCPRSPPRSPPTCPRCVPAARLHLRPAALRGRHARARPARSAREISPDEAKAHARTCALNALAAVHALVGIDSVVRVVKVVGFVASAEGFTGQPAVINGASELMRRGLRRRGSARAVRRRRRGAAARLAGRGRTDRRGRLATIRLIAPFGACADGDSCVTVLVDACPPPFVTVAHSGHPIRGTVITYG